MVAIAEEVFRGSGGIAPAKAPHDSETNVPNGTRMRPGEPPPWPQDLDEAEWQILELRWRVGEIQAQLAAPMAASLAATGMQTEDEYLGWRSRAVAALGVKRRQLGEREGWARQQRRALSLKQDVDITLAATKLVDAVQQMLRGDLDRANHLLVRAASLLTNWAAEFEEDDILAQERALLREVTDYCADHDLEVERSDAL